MTTATALSVACYLLCAAVAVLIGCKYVTRTEWMPYHAVASGLAWSGFDSRMQLTVRGILHVAGFGMLAVGAGGLALLGAWYLTGDRRVLMLTAVPGLVFTAPVLMITRRLKAQTGARTPVVPSAISLALSLAGLALSALPSR